MIVRKCRTNQTNFEKILCFVEKIKWCIENMPLLFYIKIPEQHSTNYG